TQTRLMLPGWLGVGTALEAVATEPGGLVVLRRMAHAWPFFDELLAKIEMVCAKADLAIARVYVRELGGDLGLFDHVQNEFRRSRREPGNVRRCAGLVPRGPTVADSGRTRRPPPQPYRPRALFRAGRAAPGSPAHPRGRAGHWLHRRRAALVAWQLRPYHATG